jgi:hypothetical protein
MPDLTDSRTGLPEEMRTALAGAFLQDGETHAEQYLALGRAKSVELKDYLAEQTVGTIKQWLHASDESSVAAGSDAREEPPSFSHGSTKSVPSLPMRALIRSWLEHWWFVWVLNDAPCVRALKKGILPLNGAEEYRKMIGR